MIKTQLIGRLGTDAEVTTTQGGARLMKLNIAVDMSYRNKDGEKVERTVWVRATQWNIKENSTLQNYLKKGTQVFIEGEPSANGYTNKEGSVAASLEVKINDLRLLGSANGTAPAAATPTPVATPEAKKEEEPDDLPF
jgi:single-strand DNA-binding protein